MDEDIFGVDKDFFNDGMDLFADGVCLALVEEGVCVCGCGRWCVCVDELDICET